jgi:hypothetical protein
VQKSTTLEARADENRLRETLQQVVRDGDIQSLRILFEIQAVPWWANSEKSLIETYCNALQKAVRDNDLKRAESLLSEWSADSKLPTPEAEHFKRSLPGSLPEAVMVGNRSLVSLLISYGARGSEGLVSRMTHPVSADDETFDGILQDLLDAGWELNNSAILSYVLNNN